jgi:hypothetical protein
MLRIMAEGWDASAPGVLRLPSGRLIRGRGLCLHGAEVSAPNFGLYLSNARPAPVARQARWVRWPDFRLPATVVTLLTHYAKRGFELKMSGWRSPVRAVVDGPELPLLASRRWTAFQPSRRWPSCGNTTTLARSRRRGSVGTWPAS